MRRVGVDYFEHIKSRVNVRAVLEHVLGPPVKGKWACVFHPDKTPSLSEKHGGIVCFGCNWRGDVFRFVQEHLGIGPKDALIYVGENFAGVSVAELDRPGPSRALPVETWAAIFQRESECLAAEIDRMGRLIAADTWRAAFAQGHAGNIESAWELAAHATAIDRALG